jgi:hypothetical protein
VYYRDTTLESDIDYERTERGAPEGETIVYFRPQAKDPSKRRREGSGHARGYIKDNMTLSLIPLNTNNGLDAVDVGHPGGQAWKWSPTIIDGAIPDHAVIDDSSPLFILYDAYINFNPGHLLFDDFLPWFKLMRMFNVLASDAQPLSIYPSKEFTDKKFEKAREKSIIIEPMQVLEQCQGFERMTKDTPLPKACLARFTEAMAREPAGDEKDWPRAKFEQIEGYKVSQEPVCANITKAFAKIKGDEMDRYFKSDGQNTLAMWW